MEEIINTPPLAPPPPPNSHSIRGIVALVTATLLIIPLLTYALIPPAQPLSPLGYEKMPNVVRQSLSTPDISPLTYYLAGSEKYLKEARELSHKTKHNQTELQKKSIIALLNNSLKMANNAVSYYPSSKEAYLQRARLFEVLAVLDSTASVKAASDRELASRLSPDSSPVPITPADLVRAAPLEEASLLSQAIIALPQEELEETTAEEQANATRGTATFPSGSTDIVVHTSQVRDDLLIYYTPNGDTQGQVISLTSKSEQDQSFTLHLSAPLPHDLPAEWWIVE